MKKIESSQFIKHIYHPSSSRKDKTIILYHGWGSSIKNYVSIAEYFSSLGFRVILPEIIYHDSRDKLANHFLKEVTQEYFWKTILTSIEEFNLLLEELSVPEEKVILMGISMGGFIANGIYAQSNDFAGLISINSSGSFLVSEKIFREKDQRPLMTFEEINELKAYDPVRKNVRHSPILLMHGEQDSIISIEGQKDYYKYLNNVGHTDVAFKAYRDVNHTLTEEMLEYVTQWLIEKY